MAKQSLGYIELEWTCPVCDTRNPGGQRVCQNCGSPQPDNIKFEAPAEAKITTDEATAKQATAGPDIHCPYCDARNPAGSKVCRQCGGDLTGGTAREVGQVVQGFGAQRPKEVKCPACGTLNASGARVCKNCGAPLPTVRPVVQPQPAAAPASRGCLWVAVGLVVLGLILGVFFLAGGSDTAETTGQVVDTRWTRAVEVMGLMPVQYTAWLDQIPGDAELGACYEEVRQVVDEPVPGAREVCGTPYAVDQGTGYAEVVRDCVYEIVEQRCEYTVQEWRVVNEITQDGTGFSPSWPALSLSNRQREGQRGEHYQCIFEVDGRQVVYNARNLAEYQRCTYGSVWNLEVTAEGRVVSAQPVE